MFWRALGEYATKIARVWYALLFGIVFGLVGAAKEMGALSQVPIPAWVWWLLALVTFMLANFHVFLDMVRERESYIHPLPDMPLREAVAYRIGDYDFGGNIAKTGAALVDIQEAAHLGRVVTWGRRYGWSGRPLGEIPKEAWEDHHIDPLEFLSDSSPRLEQAVGTRNTQTWYLDIHLNREQVERLWPRSRRGPRVSLRSPIVWKRSGTQA
jgi:hypothetical protein